MLVLEQANVDHPVSTADIDTRECSFCGISTIRPGIPRHMSVLLLGDDLDSNSNLRLHLQHQDSWRLHAEIAMSNVERPARSLCDRRLHHRHRVS
jgi:hypothetical protein